MRSPSKFAQGVVLFALAGYVSKLISFAYRVPYQNLAGDFGLYAYQTVYPFAAIVASLGIYAMPVVIAKIGVGAKGTNRKLEVLWGSFYALLLLSSMLVVTVWLFAPTLAKWLGDEQLAPALRVISLVIYSCRRQPCCAAHFNREMTYDRAHGRKCSRTLSA